MRGTWIILIIMIIAGVGLYFWFTRKPKIPDHDTITFTGTPDSIVRNMKVYLANDPTEVMYLDSMWELSDSTPMKEVLNGSAQHQMNKQYSAITLYLTYKDQYFYDLELKKPNPRLAYNIDLKITPQNGDTLIVDGDIKPSEGNILHFQAPMMKMYSKFVITYNYKLPQPPPDSNAIKGHDPNKTITVLKN